MRPGCGQASGGLLAGAAVGARDDDELACLIGNRIHELSLERNVSPQVAAQYKRASVAGITALGGVLLKCVTELGEHDAVRLAGVVTLMTGALWPHTQPSAAMLAAYEADPALAALRLDFTATVHELLQVTIAGLLARSTC